MESKINFLPRKLTQLLPYPPMESASYPVNYYLEYYRYVAGLHYAALRFGNVYGPRQNPEGEAGVIAIFSQQLLNGQQILINGNGLQTRDYVYVRDVVEAVMTASDQHVNGIYNCGDGRRNNGERHLQPIKDPHPSGMQGTAWPDEKGGAIAQRIGLFKTH